MNKKRVGVLSAALLLVVVVTGSFAGQQSPTNPASQEAVEYGPAKGTLVIVGVGPTNNTGIIGNGGTAPAPTPTQIRGVAPEEKPRL